MKITCPTEAFVKAVRACKYATSADETRPHLSAIWIRALAGDRAHLFATNGHWLAVTRLAGATVTKPGQANIQREDVARVLAATPGRSFKPGEVAVSCVDHSLTIGFTPGVSLMLRSHDCSPPPIVDIIPRTKSPKKHARPTLCAGILKLALSAAQEMATTKRSCGIRVIATTPEWGGPSIVWSPEAPDYFAIVMPRREDKRRDMRWWFEHADQIAIENKKATDAAAE